MEAKLADRKLGFDATLLTEGQSSKFSPYRLRNQSCPIIIFDYCFLFFDLFFTSSAFLRPQVTSAIEIFSILTEQGLKFPTEIGHKNALKHARRGFSDNTSEKAGSYAPPRRVRMPDGQVVVKPRKFRGTVKVDQNRCKGCGFCIEFCPPKVLAFSEEFNTHGYHPPFLANEPACTGCDLCGLYCPDFAIFGVRIPIENSQQEAK